MNQVQFIDNYLAEAVDPLQSIHHCLCCFGPPSTAGH